MFSPPPTEQREKRSLIPWIVAGAVVVLVLVVILVATHHPQETNPGGSGLAAADPYAANLPISNVQMSQSGSMSGGQTTYIDGQITNKGQQTVTGITVQVAFHGFTTPIAKKATLPLMLVRTRQPYVDLQAVSAAPILPGQSRDFRLIFDSVPQDWNQNYPEIRVIQVTGK
jgi:uncharacterized protein DUF2393